MGIEASRTRRWLVSGLVQGVGFRWFVYQAARELGATGWVRNLPSGDVEVVGQGTPSVVDALERRITRGPAYARVENVEKTDVTSQEDTIKSFDIK